MSTSKVTGSLLVIGVSVISVSFSKWVDPESINSSSRVIVRECVGWEFVVLKGIVVADRRFNTEPKQKSDKSAFVID